MKVTLFAAAAMIFYAIQNVTIERKLADLSPLVLIFFFGLGLAFTSGAIISFQQFLGIDQIIPRWNQYWFIVFCAVLLVIADWSYFSAYHVGGSVTQVTTVVILMPVVASLINGFTGGAWISWNRLLAWLLSAIAVWLVSK